MQAMDNSIGNMGKQLGSLIHNKGQGGTNLQQTPTVDPANSFQQVGFLICSASVQAFWTWSASIMFSQKAAAKHVQAKTLRLTKTLRPASHMRLYS